LYGSLELKIKRLNLIWLGFEFYLFFSLMAGWVIIPVLLHPILAGMPEAFPHIWKFQ
jgi:hypothetical protein